MAKTIRVDDETYAKLESARGKRETFSDVVGRLLSAYSIVGQLVESLKVNPAAKGEEVQP